MTIWTLTVFHGGKGTGGSTLSYFDVAAADAHTATEMLFHALRDTEQEATAPHTFPEGITLTSLSYYAPRSDLHVEGHDLDADFPAGCYVLYTGPTQARQYSALVGRELIVRGTTPEGLVRVDDPDDPEVEGAEWHLPPLRLTRVAGV